jgi:hypothetical protein
MSKGILLAAALATYLLPAVPSLAVTGSDHKLPSFHRWWVKCRRTAGRERYEKRDWAGTLLVTVEQSRNTVSNDLL